MHYTDLPMGENIRNSSTNVNAKANYTHMNDKQEFTQHARSFTSYGADSQIRCKLLCKSEWRKLMIYILEVIMEKN